MIIGTEKDLCKTTEYITPLSEDWKEIKTFYRDKKNELYHYREKTTEQYTILSGEIFIKGKVYGAGTVLIYKPYERRNFFALSNVTCLSVKNPLDAKDDELQEGEMSLDCFIEPYQYKKNEVRYNAIEYKDITVVLQGAVDKVYTKLAIESVRRFLPGANIILSTWSKNECDGLLVDKIVLNEDPGAPSYIKVNGKNHTDNRNRLLVSSQGGISNVKTKYTLKMRSDCILSGDGIVRNFGRYDKKLNQLSIFSKKLMVGEQCNILKLHFKEFSRPYLFHISDWFVFGLTEDVEAYFIGTEVESDAQMTEWKYKNDLFIPEDDLMGLSASPRYNSEQYYFISALKRKYEIYYDDVSDYSEIAEKQSKTAIIDNFEILNIHDHEIINAKKQNRQAWDLDKETIADYFTSKKYVSLYEEYFKE